MRILLLNYEFPPIGGGGGYVTKFLGEHFAKAGGEVFLLTSRYRELSTVEQKNGIHIIRIPVLRKRPDVCSVHEMATYVLSAVMTAHRLLQKWKPDIVQAFFGVPSGPVAYVIHKRYAIPYVVFLGGRDVPRRNADPPAYRFWYSLLKPVIRAVWTNAAAVVACSNGLRDLARQTDSRVPIQVIPDGVDLSSFQSVERITPSSNVCLLVVSRLIPRKRIDLLIDALVKLKTRHPFIVRIVGDGPERRALEQRVIKHELSSKIRFIGAVSYAKLIKYYNEADVFVHCAEAEGMPLVVLEAMACGLPIVATRVQGIEDLVEPGENGYLYDPGDVDTLARYLTDIIDFKNQRLSMGQQSSQKVRSYDWSAIAQQYLDLYQQIIRAKNRSHEPQTRLL